MFEPRSFYNEWIEQADPEEDCIRQCELIALIKHLGIEFDDTFHRITILLPKMCPDIARWYGIKWAKPLPCEVDYWKEIQADIDNEKRDREHDDVHKGRYVYDPYSLICDSSRSDQSTIAEGEQY